MMTRGGEGGKKCPKFDDVICERPLTSTPEKLFLVTSAPEKLFLVTSAPEKLFLVTSAPEKLFLVTVNTAVTKYL